MSKRAASVQPTYQDIDRAWPYVTAPIVGAAPGVHLSAE